MGDKLTDQVQLEELLNESNARFLFVNDHMEEGYFETDLSGDLTFYNHMLCRIVGYPEDKLQGMKYQSFLLKDCVKDASALFQDVYEKKERQPVFHGQVVTQYGIKKQVQVNVFLKKDTNGRRIGFGGIVKDLSRRKKIIEKLVEAGADWKMFADSLPQIVFQINASGMVSFINRNVYNLMGYEQKECLHVMHLHDLICERYRDSVTAYIQKCFIDLADNGLACHALKKDGGSFPVILYANLVIRGNQPVHIRGFLVDVSERQKTDAKLQKAEETSIHLANKEKNTRKIFQKYISDEVVNQVMSLDEKDLIAVGEKKTISVLNVDIRGYSLLTKTVDAEKVILVLNYFLMIMGKTVLFYNGMIDKYLGDGLMAIFGAPSPLANPSINATKASIDMIKNSKEVSRFSMDLCNMPLTVGVSINTGEAIVGNIGFDKKINYTAIGAVVNNTFRLQEHTRTKPNSILICDKTLAKIEPYMHESSLSDITVQSCCAKINAYELRYIDPDV